MAVSSAVLKLGWAGRAARAAASQSGPAVSDTIRRRLCAKPSTVAGKEHSRKHLETRTLPFSPHELYSVVADVDSYSEFVPWCTSSNVVKRIGQDHLVAELGVGFQVLSEKYTSLITLEPHRSIKADVPNSSLFNYLINDWTFEAGQDKSMTELTFYVEFQFRNPLYQRITDLFFNEVVKNMVNAFERRAFVKYRSQGPNFELF
jgi:ribosome-associated toxin RatA of RatAB toxin-antitoxin module